MGEEKTSINSSVVPSLVESHMAQFTWLQICHSIFVLSLKRGWEGKKFYTHTRHNFPLFFQVKIQSHLAQFTWLQISQNIFLLPLKRSCWEVIEVLYTLFVMSLWCSKSKWNLIWLSLQGSKFLIVFSLSLRGLV